MMWFRHRLGRRDDEGFALIFVMFISLVVMAAVAATLTVTTPNIISSKNDQDAGSALIAAQSGVDDVIAYLLSVPACRSTTKICVQALGADSSTLSRNTTLGTGQSFSWTTSSQLTPDEYVRAYVTGRAGTTTQKITADLSLAPSILSFGYYTNYESQSPDILYDYFAGRTIKLTDANTYKTINAYNTSGRTVSVTSPTTVKWNGPATSGSNPYPASICGQHWYRDSDASPGRYTYGSNSVWGETGAINGNSMTRTASCDVVFTSGMTLDGPLYTRDALLISDGTNGGTGPIFKQPAYTLWGFPGYNTPVPSTTPWRKDAGVGGDISSGSYSPQTAGLDLVLPEGIGTDGLPDNYCLYKGPTRVVMNGDGTATVTSPYTTSRNAASSASCYPTGSLSSGILNFTLNYKTAGSGTIYVQNLTASGANITAWPENPTKATNTPSASNEVFWVPAVTGGTTTPDADSSAAPDTCSTSATYSSTAGGVCGWSNLASATDNGSSSTGWTAYTKTTCGTAAPTDRELFECEWAGSSSSTQPTVNLAAGGYKALRTAFTSSLNSNGCVTGDNTARMNCLVLAMNTAIMGANSGDHPYNYATPAAGDHRYIALSKSTGSAASGVAKSVGSAPDNPMAGDAMYDYAGTPAQETPSRTPFSLTIARQTYDCYAKTSPFAITTATNCTKTNPTGAYGWGDGSKLGQDIDQFTTTVTQTHWTISTQATGNAYFPDTADVTAYNAGSTNSGAYGGSTAANQPGDLYVEGPNKGQLSLIAQNDVIVTNDITSPTPVPATTEPYNSNTDAVDIVAGSNVRNYHPVSCDDTTAADIDGTDAGWCPNDITGLYRSVLESNGTLFATHPAMQYDNMIAAQTNGPRRVDAAVFALSGSFVTDNYNRGLALGKLTVNGGIYQSHRGANGTQWEYTGSGPRPSSGYSLQYHFMDLEHANLPYAPPATGGSNSRVWNVVSISAGA